MRAENHDQFWQMAESDFNLQLSERRRIPGGPKLFHGLWAGAGAARPSPGASRAVSPIRAEHFPV